MKTKTKKPLTEAELIEARDRLQEIRADQESLRQEELQIREYVVERLYPVDKEEGAATVTVGSIKVSLEKKFNRSISAADVDLLKEENPKLFAEVIRWSPAIRVGVYKNHKDVMDRFITTTAAPGSITFK